MKQAIALALTIALVPSTAIAGGNANVYSVETGNEQNNETVQENVGIVNQHTSYSVGQASTYRIDSVVCPNPALVVSGSTSGGGNFDSSYAVSASLVVPLGGRDARSCTEALESRNLHYQLQNEVAVSKECTAIIGAGVVLNQEQFPLLSQYCNGVSRR